MNQTPIRNERRTESSSLLHHTTRCGRWQNFSCGRCQLPSEKTLTVLILGTFVLGIMFLLTMQNITSSSANYSTIEPILVYTAAYFKEADSGDENIIAILKQGEQLIKERRNLELLLLQKHIIPEVGSAAEMFQNFLKSPPLENVTKCSLIVEHMKRILGACVNETYLPAYCLSSNSLHCDANALYRSYNGSCNNLKYPRWGMSETAFLRLLKPDYADGVSLPRISTLGDHLPSARLLSSKLYSHKMKSKSNLTLMGMNFGLFIDHDIIRIATQAGRNSAGISCCDHKILETPELKHPECFEIPIPPSDPFYGPLNLSCMNFIRSKPSFDRCLGQREQMNLVSSYIDGSAIYGTQYQETEVLRSFVNGRLKGTYIHGRQMPAIEKNDPKIKNCGTPKIPLSCFNCGDNRVNEHVDLVAMHTLWFREHNRITGHLFTLNPSWDDERLYQEARRIVIAEIQHITYKELLPPILGDKIILQYDLAVKQGKKYDGYNPEKNAGIFNVFGAAAFRFGHSLIQGVLAMYGKDYNRTGYLLLHETFTNPDAIYKGNLDMLLRGMAVQDTQPAYNYITQEVRDRLFQPYSGTFGLDLAAIGIQRGRDHGLPGYTKWREYCNLAPVNAWNDLYKDMDKENVDRLESLYMVIDDVDLTPGSLPEHHMPGSMLGPTYNCLIAQQFHALKFGDRFWYEVQEKPWSFTPDQLMEIYKTSMARIVCDNSDDLESIQRFAFIPPSQTNSITSCLDLPSLNLTKWVSRMEQVDV